MRQVYERTQALITKEKNYLNFLEQKYYWLFKALRALVANSTGSKLYLDPYTISIFSLRDLVVFAGEKQLEVSLRLGKPKIIFIREKALLADLLLKLENYLESKE